MPKIRPETAIKRRMAILEAGHRAFNAHGINVSVDQICAEAGVSKGNFYGYFDSKDALILAIAQHQGEGIRNATKVSSVDELVARLMPFQQDADVSASRFELEAWTYSLSHPELRSIFQQNLQDLDQAITASLLELAPELGSVPQERATATAEMLRTLAVGVMATTAIVDGSDSELGAAFRRLVRLLMGGPEDTPDKLR